jgi:hypothetical protein
VRRLPVGIVLIGGAAALFLHAPPVPAAAAATDVPVGPGSLSGVWTNADYPRNAGFQPREHIRKTVEGKVPPLLPWAAALLEQRVKASEAGKVFASPKSQCLPAGVPAMMFPAGSPLQILENPGQVTILVEEPNFFRIIPLNQKHEDDPDPSFLGDSVGHWEGDTLVVDTVAVTDKVPIDPAGMPHSDAMHVVERYRRTSKDILEVLLTIDDPKTFASPWDAVTHFKLQPSRRVTQYFCENNRDLGNERGQIELGRPGK